MQSESKQEGDLPVADGRELQSGCCRCSLKARGLVRDKLDVQEGKAGQAEQQGNRHLAGEGLPPSGICMPGKGPLDAVCVHLPAGVPGSWPWEGTGHTPLDGLDGANGADGREVRWE
jgi:hypothetical protein